MTEAAFAQLVESIKQAGEIRRSERAPGRVFHLQPNECVADLPRFAPIATQAALSADQK